MTQDRSALVVGSEHIDQYGHVGYKAVASMLEPYQDVVLASRGTTFETIEACFGLRSFVRKLEILYPGQLKEGDKCEVSTELEFGRTSMTFKQIVTRADLTVLTLTMVVVMVDGDGEKAPIPEELKEQLS